MSEIISLVMIFVPLFLIVWLANLAQKQREAGENARGLTIVTYVFLIALYVGALLVGVVAQVAAAGLAANPSLVSDAGIDVPFASLPLLAVGLWLPALLGLICLLRPVRRLVASFTALDPDGPIDTVALSLSMLVLLNLLVTLGVGLGNFADLLAESDTAEGVTVLSLWIQQILTALLAFVGVGWLTRRTWGETLARLGLVWPNVREWAISIGVAFGMVVVVVAVEQLAEVLGITTDADVERLSEELLGSLFTSPLGILTLGVSAGLGEETLFRGALVPRFGVILTAIFFALVHSQYGITLSTLIVLILGLVLGWLRLRYNTSTAMITHAVYNMTLGLIAVLGANMLDV